jgi:DNA-binding NtrC family response regulator
MSGPAHVFVVDDDRGGRESLARALRKAGHEVEAFTDGREALERMESGTLPDIVLTDVRMPDVDGLSLLRRVKERSPDLPVILITGYGSIAGSFEAGRLGADLYLEKPLDIHEVRRRVAELVELRRGPTSAGSAEELLPGLIGRSPEMARLVEQLRLVAPTQATVLVLGESGTGKELVARALHELSDRRERTFLPLNCAAIPGHLLESELFGHERGAFTGAIARQPGKFELVGDGTLFLDEIGELAADLQAKLLRVLEDRRFMRVGGSQSLAFEARLVAASNRDLEDMVSAGHFRDDLYYRLKVVNLIVPPLRERAGDARLLAESFLRRFADYYGKGVMRFDPLALEALESARWEGNVRELRNLVESLVVLSHGGATLRLEDLPPAYRAPAAAPPTGVGSEAEAEPATPRTMDEIERDAILEALEASGGNRERTARRLGIGLRTLQRKIKEYRDQGIDI